MFADLILPLSLPGTYTYRVPEGMELLIGQRVTVPFGRRKIYTGLVRRFHQQAPKGFRPKDILAREDDTPLLQEEDFLFWEWLADYYLCTPGEVMLAALPGGLKLESETTILRNHEEALQDEALSDEGFLVMEALSQQPELRLAELGEITGLKNPMPLVKNLLEARLVVLKEEIRRRPKPRQQRLVKLGEDFQANSFDQLERAPKQRELLLHFFRLRGDREKLSAARLLKESGAGEGSLQGLIKKNWLTLETQEVMTESGYHEAQIQALPDLNPGQADALVQLQAHWQKLPVCLLHGVTGSGKTAVSSHLIAERLATGQKVLYLVPEIALTTQLIHRLARHFGPQMLVYHSRYSDRERRERWLELAQSEGARLILGARSALFLPLRNLGLIVVDEEHESSFKQQDPAPRYHARDAAIYLAGQRRAQVLLGTATPSLESYANAQQGKYAYVQLKQRFGNLPLPRIQMVDLTEAKKKRELHGALSETLLKALEETLQARRQSILFQNRRGFTTVMQCQSCGEVLQCQNCDISLTYHKSAREMHCHYCGYRQKVPQKCPACQSPTLRNYGLGTEKLEDDLRLTLPKAQIRRMDLDTTRRKNAFAEIIASLESGETDILVGTQMVTKGLDFDNVALVGIISADALLNFPDFRAHERAFQLLAQVAGRAGRKNQQGLVLIQSFQPKHPVLQQVSRADYQEFARQALAERRQFQYPPFYRLIRITLQHRQAETLQKHAHQLSQAWKPIFGERLLGPEFPPVARLRNRYRMEFLLKLEAGISLPKSKQALREAWETHQKLPGASTLRLIFDVDPY